MHTSAERGGSLRPAAAARAGVRVPGDRLRRGYQKESYTDKREAKQHEACAPPPVPRWPRDCVVSMVDAPQGGVLQQGSTQSVLSLRRAGLSLQEHDAAAHEEVTSLVLATHGIGQNIEGSNIAHDTDIMRELVGSMYRQVRPRGFSLAARCCG